VSTPIDFTDVPLRISTSTVNVKHGTLNANKTFNTNLPLNSVMYIFRVQHVFSIKDWANAYINQAPAIFQVLSQLTENTANTAVSQSDPLAISNGYFEQRLSAQSLVGFQGIDRNPLKDGEDDFAGIANPTVAQTLNMVVSAVEVVGNMPVNGVDVFMYIWYKLVSPIPQSIKDRLVNRLALQR
jgi:hypothetical protein